MANGKWYINEDAIGKPGETYTVREYSGLEDYYNFAIHEKTYDTKTGRLIQENLLNQDVYDGRTIYNYGADGNLASYENYNGTTGNYDASGNLISVEHLGYDGTVSGTTEYRYDAAGNQISAISYNTDGSFDSASNSTHDASGRLISSKSVYSDGSVQDYSATYDSFGNIVSEKTDQGEKVYNYDQRTGELLGSKTYGKDGALLSSEEIVKGDGGIDGTPDITKLKYDANGDMTGYTVYGTDADGNVIYITERDKNDKTLREVELGYDAQGNITSYADYYISPSGERKLQGDKLEYVYDETGAQVACRTYDKDGNLTSSSVAKTMVFGGKAYTFNANELRGIIGSLESSSSELSGILSSMNGVCSSIAGIAAGRDSGLSGSLNNLGEACSIANTSIKDGLATLAVDIGNYITQTQKHEYEGVQNLDAVNEELDNMISTMSGIK